LNRGPAPTVPEVVLRAGPAMAQEATAG